MSFRFFFRSEINRQCSFVWNVCENTKKKTLVFVGGYSTSVADAARISPTMIKDHNSLVASTMISLYLYTIGWAVSRAAKTCFCKLKTCHNSLIPFLFRFHLSYSMCACVRACVLFIFYLNRKNYFFFLSWNRFSFLICTSSATSLGFICSF